MFDLQATCAAALQAGKLKAIAVTSPARSPLLPNVPTMIESGVPGYDVSAWFGLFAPAGLAKPIRDRLGAEVSAIIRSADLQKRLRELGAEPDTSSPDDYPAFVRSEAAKWAATVRAAGLAP